MLIFDSRPDPERHPDRMRTLARLKGLNPTAVSKATILDIGCGTGLDLLAHAIAFPTAKFIGLDIAAEFINLGKQIIKELKLENVQLVCGDIKEYKTDLRFDYIICHGVYSWVNSELQQSLLSVIQSTLEPTGIAYISYNSLPGWHYRRVVQRLIKLFDDQKLAVQQRVDLAINSMNKALLGLSDMSDHQTECLRNELQSCLKQSPAFIYHELLNFDCTAEYLEDFARKAADYRLRYFADGRPTRIREHRYTEAERKRAAQLGLAGQNPEKIEQFWDLLQPLALRGALFCHADQAVSSAPEYSHVMQMYISSALVAESKDVDLAGTRTETFRDARDLLVEVSDPILKSILTGLSGNWPKAVAVKEIIQNPKLSQLPSSTSLLQELGQYFLQGLVQLYNEVHLATNKIMERPKVFPLAICQARIGFAWVTNARFEFLPINEFDRELIQLLDGNNDSDRCVAALLERINSGAIAASITDEHQGQDLKHLLKQQVVASLEHYRDTALLID